MRAMIPSTSTFSALVFDFASFSFNESISAGFCCALPQKQTNNTITDSNFLMKQVLANNIKKFLRDVLLKYRSLFKPEGAYQVLHIIATKFIYRCKRIFIGRNSEIKGSP